MKRKMRIGAFALAVVLAAGNMGTYRITAKAEERQMEVQNAKGVDDIVFTLENNGISMNVSNWHRDERAKIKKQGSSSGQWESLLNFKTVEQKYVDFSKEELGSSLTIKVEGSEKTRTLHFSTGQPISADDIKVNAEKTEITVKEEGLEVRLKGGNSDAAWASIEGKKFLVDFSGGMEAKTFEIRRASFVQGDHFRFASTPVEKSVDRSEKMNRQIQEVIFVAKGEVNGELLHFDSDMEYSLNGGGTWQSFTAASYRIGGGITASNDIVIRYRDNDRFRRTLDVTQEDISQYKNQIVEKNGVITKIPEGFEWKEDKKENWTPVENGSFVAPKSGVYRLRKAASGSMLASAIGNHIVIHVNKVNGGGNPQVGGGQGNPQIGGDGGGAVGGENAGEVPNVGNGGNQAQNGVNPGGNIGGAPNVGNQVQSGANPGGSNGGAIGGAVNGNSSQTEKKNLMEEPKNQEEKAEAEPKKDVTKIEEKNGATEKSSSVIKLDGKTDVTGKNVSVKVTKALLGNEKEVRFQIGTDADSYLFKVKKEDLGTGKKGKVFEEKNGKLILIEKKIYTVTKAGLSVSLKTGKNYVFLSEKEAKKVEKKIENSLKLSQNMSVVKRGTKGKIAFIKGFEKRNIKSIRYVYDKKQISVDKKGSFKIKAKKGMVAVRVAVTLKNGKTKMLTFKTNVK